MSNSIVSSENPIVFVSKSQMLDVIIESEKKQVLAGSSEVELVPARHARFRGFQFVTEHEDEAILMINRLVRNRKMRVIPSFWLHPDHIDQGRELCAKHYPDQNADAILGIRKQEVVEEAQADASLATLQKQVAEMASQMSQVLSENVALKAHIADGKVADAKPAKASKAKAVKAEAVEPVVAADPSADLLPPTEAKADDWGDEIVPPSI